MTLFVLCILLSVIFIIVACVVVFSAGNGGDTIEEGNGFAQQQLSYYS